MSRFLSFIFFLLLLVTLAALFVSRALCLFELRRNTSSSISIVPEKEKAKTTSEQTKSNKTLLKEKGKSFGALPHEDVSVTSNDGLALSARLYPSQSHRYAITVHGYKTSSDAMLPYASYFSDWGFNVLVPDLRAHGESEGEMITMGYKESEDLLIWIDFILSRDSSAEIFLHGVSMGGASVMLLSGESLPQNVKAIIEDCGYTSAWDINLHEIKEITHLGFFPFPQLVDLFFRHYTGISSKDISCVQAVSRSTVPMLFIHGGNDDFVESWMLDENYSAKTTGYKEKLLVPGAKHAESYTKDTELYFGTIREFLSKAGFPQ